MKNLVSIFLVAISAVASMIGFIHTISFNHTPSAPIILLVLGISLIGIAGTVRRKV